LTRHPWALSYGLSGDPRGFWQRRRALAAALPYFHGWCDLHAALLPASMTADLRAVLAEVTDAISPATPPHSRGRTEPA
jgi:hypothetical protein